MEKPDTKKRECGGWIATSGRWEKIKIGTTGATEEEARTRFAEAMRAWRVLLGLEEPLCP